MRSAVCPVPVARGPRGRYEQDGRQQVPARSEENQRSDSSPPVGGGGRPQRQKESTDVGGEDGVLNADVYKPLNDV